VLMFFFECHYFSIFKTPVYEAFVCDLDPVNKTCLTPTAFEQSYVIQETIRSFQGQSGLRVALCMPPAEQSVHSTLNQLVACIFKYSVFISLNMYQVLECSSGILFRFTVYTTVYYFK
jgi:hypothetical protein